MIVVFIKSDFTQSEIMWHTHASKFNSETFFAFTADIVLSMRILSTCLGGFAAIYCFFAKIKENLKHLNENPQWRNDDAGGSKGLFSFREVGPQDEPDPVPTML